MPGGGKLVWVTGWPGCGKTTLGEYLSAECGWTSVDVDNYMNQWTDRALAAKADEWRTSWGAFFRGEPPPQAQWEPFLRHAIEQVRGLRADGRDVVVTQGIHRAGRDWLRAQFGSDLVIIGLTASPEKTAERLLVKEKGYYSLVAEERCGQTLEAAFRQRTGAEFTRAAWVAERAAALAKNPGWGGMAADDGEPGSHNIDISDDAAVIPRAREILGLPPVPGGVGAGRFMQGWLELLRQSKVWRKHGVRSVVVDSRRGAPEWGRRVARLLAGSDAERPYERVELCGRGASAGAAADAALRVVRGGAAEVARVETRPARRGGVAELVVELRQVAAGK